MYVKCSSTYIANMGLGHNSSVYILYCYGIRCIVVNRTTPPPPLLLKIIMPGQLT